MRTITSLAALTALLIPVAAASTTADTTVHAAEFVADGPTRIADTREERPRGVMRDGDVLRLSVGADPVVLNVTAAAPTARGHASVYPCAAGGASTSILNFGIVPGAVPNMVVATPDSRGEVCIGTRVLHGGTVHLAVDRTGSLDAFAAANTRRYDSRRSGGARAAGSVTRVGGFAPGEVHAVNVTVANPADSGHVRVFPCDAARPAASAGNYQAGVTRATMTMSRASAAGEVCVYTSGRTNLVVDHFGSVGSTDVEFSAPDRVFDSRAGNRGTFFRVPLPDVDDRAVALVVTAVGHVGGGFLTVWDCAVIRPTASTVNFRVPFASANSIILDPSTSGEVCVHSSASTHVIVDLTGYIGARPTPPPTTAAPPTLTCTQLGLGTVNRWRANEGRPALSWSSSLYDGACRQAIRNAEAGTLLPHPVTGEVAHYGASCAGAFEAWRNSQSHYLVLTSSLAASGGIACVETGGLAYTVGRVS